MDRSTPAASRGPRWVLAAAVLLLAGLSALFWKLRILDSAVVDTVTIPNIDLFVGQAPMTAYAFEEVRAGRLPLWNPYQLCGTPFLAVTYVGLFYPPNWIYLLVNVPTGIEVAFLLHMLFGAVGMWLFARHLQLGWLAGIASGLTFMWSGFVSHWANQPQLFAGLAWAPWTLLATHAALGGARRGSAALAVVVACQLLNGAMEILLHTLYLAGGYTAMHLVLRTRAEGAAAALRPATSALIGLGLGIGLAGVQLLPTLELVAQSARAPGELGFEEVVLRGRLAPAEFAQSATAAEGLASTGVLSLVAFALAAGLRRQRALWGFCAVSGVVAVWLAFGGLLFRLYTELPLGTLFRRSYKFLDIYAFAQALLVALAVARLWTWSGRDRASLWRTPTWGLAVALAIALSLGRLLFFADAHPGLLAMTALLLAYGAASRSDVRRGLVAALVAVHAASLFAGVENRFIRPIHRPDYPVDHAGRNRLDLASPRDQHERVYLSPTLWFMKQGTAQQIPVVTDYEPLALARYAEFFETASGFRPKDRPFNGRYFLSSRSRWPMMDLTGTRYYVINPWDLKLLGHFRAAGPEAGFFPREEAPRRVIERPSALPRVWVAGAWRALADRGAVLAALAEPGFDARSEVLLESPLDRPSGAPGRAGSARIVSYEPEEVVISVEAERPGLLVLSDVFYAGWEAFVDGHETSIERADYLFRAVQVEAGASEVRFVYRPGSLRAGAALSGGSALALGFLALGSRRRP